MNKIIIFLPFFILLSCSIQKRKYQNGYYVNWSIKKERELTKLRQSYPTKSLNGRTQSKFDVNYDNTKDLNNIVASIKGEYISLKRELLFFKKKTDTCDHILFMDGNEFAVKVLEINKKIIKYKRCDVPEGPVFVSKRSKVKRINFNNGTKIEIDSVDHSSNETKSEESEYLPLAIEAYLSAWLSILSGWAIGVYIIGMGMTNALIALPFLLGLFAIIGGIIANKKINEQPKRYKGKGMANWAFILGLCSVIIFALTYLAVLFLFV